MVGNATFLRHEPALEAAMHALQPIGQLTAPPAPEYHGYLGTVTNATILLLVICRGALGSPFAVRSQKGSSTDFGEVNEDQFQSLITMVHRAYYANLPAAIELMCKDYCKARGTVGPSGTKFLDYINAALNASALPDQRKRHWRNFFDGVRILRNKSSHSDTSFTTNERQALAAASLNQHIDANGCMHSNMSNYAPIAFTALDFIKELDAS